MYSLFSTNPDTAGFRLQYMEVFNWGTFHNNIFKINPEGNNSLLTGANASGKSTLIDALLTLLVPAKKDRFYNQSSGAEKKGDRTEETYVLGNYGNIQREGEMGTITQSLRDKNTYSIILASFSSADMKTITLFQSRWFTNGELKRAFGLAHCPLTIEQDFSRFDNKGVWKKLLEKTYNSHTTKKRVEFFNGPTDYGERISHLFGMLSKGLALFNQIVGVKVLEDLDEFIRTNMLEEQNAEAEYVQLKTSFLTLMEAKINIEKVKEQMSQLMPINDIAVQLDEIREKLQTLRQSRDTAVYWFAKKTEELAEKEIDQENRQLDELNEELENLQYQEADLKHQETALTVEIEKDATGNQVKELEREIGRLEKMRDNRKQKLENYNKIAQKVALDINPTNTIFKENREKASAKRTEMENLLIIKNEELRQAKNKEDETRNLIEENIRIIQSLQKNKNNISGREAEIREMILKSAGATSEEIPFIGELVRVKDDERMWEQAIEKILHFFALRLIVPEKYYVKVNAFVHANNLNGRIIYQRYRGFTSMGQLQQRNIAANSLIHKIEFNPKNNYTDWLEDAIFNQYNFACVNDLSEFNSYNERAVTKEGLIKFDKGKHEKDDRPHVTHRENYVLGWDNKEKIKLIQSKTRDLQEKQKQIQQQIRAIEKAINDTTALKDDFSNLFNTYVKYEEIDWETYAVEIEEKKDRKTELEKTNEKVQILQKQLNDVQEKLKKLSEEIKNKQREIFQKEREIEIINNELIDSQNLLRQLGSVDILDFETTETELQNITFKNIKDKQKAFQDKNSRTTDDNERLANSKERDVASLIMKFKNPSQEIAEKFKDWRSDVNKLPDVSHLDLLGEYQAFYHRLKEDDLVRFEKKFNEYLRETITNKVGDFRTFFEQWSDSIKENIRYLNESLQRIEFNNSPKTYIQLVSSPKINDEISDFRKLLRDAIPNIREVDATIDGRKNHFNNHIQPLITKLENEQWRKKVMDVRTWFTYKAEEFYKENQQKYKTYENMGQLSGGEKAQLTYTILGSAIAYQFGLTKEGFQPNSFRFIAIDEAFKSQDEDKARYLITLCKQLHLQLLVVTPSDNIHVVEHDISYVHYVERKGEKYSWLYNMPIEEFKEEREKYVRQ
jgi:uncharacterized protein YPO0396